MIDRWDKGSMRLIVAVESTEHRILPCIEKERWLCVFEMPVAKDHTEAPAMAALIGGRVYARSPIAAQNRIFEPVAQTDRAETHRGGKTISTRSVEGRVTKLDHLSRL